MTPLTDPLPLRRTSVWGSYRTDAVIPWRFGACGGEPVAYDTSGRLFVWADHASQSVDEVLIDDVPSFGWAWRNGTDSTGRPVTFVELTTPLNYGARIIVRGRGYVSPTRGHLVENPGDIMRTIVAQLLQAPNQGERWAGFINQCDAHGLVAAGSLHRSDVTALQALREIAQSFDAAYAVDARDGAYLRFGEIPEPAETIEAANVVSGGQCALPDLLTRLTLRYGFEAEQNRGAVVVQAPASVRKFGIREAATVDARWIGSSRVAAYVASRMLERMARRCWTVDIAEIAGPVAVGDALRLDHRLLPVSTVARVEGRAYDFQTRKSSATVSIVVGATPRVVIIRTSSQAGIDSYASATVAQANGENVVTLLQADGLPYAFCIVTLDGDMTRTSDGAGRVRFPSYAMLPGEHTLSITTPDGQTFAVTVTV